METKALIIEDLMVTYPNFRLHINHLELEKGYVYGLIGKNGSGKTTMLKCVVNLIRHINDSILILGKELSKNEIELKNCIGYVNDEFIFPGHMNAKKLVQEIACFYNKFDSKYFYSLLDILKIDRNAKFSTLSKGNKHKVMIAFVLSYQPELIILDEPTANIDPVSRREILDLLFENIKDSNTTIIFSTHITSDLDRIADYVILLDNGNIIFNLSKVELEEEYQKVYLDEIDDEIKPFLKGIKTTSQGYEALCTKTSKFINNTQYTFKRANIEEIMYYWEINHE